MLQRVSIQNFKSLKDVTLDLQKVNLLIGPNNSGKTNFLKALEIFESATNHLIGINIQALKFNRENNDAFIKLVFNGSPLESEGYPFSVWNLNMASNNVNQVSGWYTKGLEDSNITNPFPIHSGWVALRFGKLTIYKPDPNQIKKSFPLLPENDFVLSDASNIIAYFDTLRDRFPDSFTNIQNDFSSCIPEFSQIRFENIKPNGEQIKIHGDKTFKRLGLYNHHQDLVFWSDEISEGAVYLLALLCIVHQPNPPKLLLLEEPEKGIHPRRIHEVMNFIFQLADEKDVQVIMTTHSPIVVDMFKDMPESVFIFDKDEEGATHVKNLLTDIIEPETEESKRLNIDPPHYLDGLGEAWKVGFLGGVPR